MVYTERTCLRVKNVLQITISSQTNRLLLIVTRTQFFDCLNEFTKKIFLVFFVENILLTKRLVVTILL